MLLFYSFIVLLDNLSWDRFQWELFAAPASQTSDPFFLAHIRYVGALFEHASMSITETQNNASSQEYTIEAEATITNLLINSTGD